jgi:hypothetical protein
LQQRFSSISDDEDDKKARSITVWLVSSSTIMIDNKKNVGIILRDELCFPTYSAYFHIKAGTYYHFEQMLLQC